MIRGARMPSIAKLFVNGLSLCMLTAALILISPLLHAQTTTSTMSGREPVNEPVHDLTSVRSDMRITERFSKLIKHKHMIKTVDGFDPEVIGVTALDQYTLRVQAKTAGVTNIILVDEFDNSYEIEIFVEGDVRHLQAYIKRLFPESSIEVVKIGKNVVLRGWVSNPDEITEIVEIAREFYPEPVNQMKLGGPNQVQLRVKVMEVQRSKIRQFGFNWIFLSSDFAMASTPGASMPLTSFDVPIGGGPAATLGSLTQSSLAFGISNGSSVFTGFLEALKREGLLEILAEPVLVTTSGRPANLLAGGEFPILVPQSLGTTTIQWREYGVRLEAVPIILGNGNLRLEVAPEVSDRDFTNAVSVNGFTVPGLTTRRVNTQVEMKFGQTLIIGGLISTRDTAETARIPYLGDLPWVGAAFRRVRYDQTETELLILVTPELVSPVDHPEQLPPPPGTMTTSPTDRELYWHGLLEIPVGSDQACPPIGGPDCYPEFSSPIPAVQGEVMMPQGTSSMPYDDSMQPQPMPSTLILPKAEPTPPAPGLTPIQMSPSGSSNPSTKADPMLQKLAPLAPPVHPGVQTMTSPSTTSTTPVSPITNAQVSWIEEGNDGKSNVVQADRYRSESTKSTGPSDPPKTTRRLSPANRNLSAPDPKF